MHEPGKRQSFNSTLVQLKDVQEKENGSASYSFNSTLVQLKVELCEWIGANKTMFQFYPSSIKSH